MQTELNETQAEHNGALYVIQMVLGVNPNCPRWYTVGWQSFRKDTTSFIQTEEGRTLMRQLDTPPPFVGGQVSPDVSFNTLSSAREFLQVVQDGGWCGGSKTRIALYAWHDFLEVVA